MVIKEMQKKPSREQFDEMVGMIKDGKLAELVKFDQLKKSMLEKKVFVGFREGELDFPPTFSMERDAELAYADKRSPAWCDRILWRSLPGFESEVKQIEFKSSLKILTSDHKPVYGIFTLKKFHLPRGLEFKKGQAILTITKLKGAGLMAMDVGGTSDPFVVFRSPLLIRNAIRTPTLKKTLTPEWPDKAVPAMELTVNRAVRLERGFIFVRVFDHDRGSQNDFMGGAVLPLGDAVRGVGTDVPFNLELTQYGLPAGSIQGMIKLTIAAAE